MHCHDFHLEISQDKSNFVSSIKNDISLSIHFPQKKPLSATNEDRALADFILNEYTGGRGRNITMDQLPNITDLMTDAFFNYGIERYRSKLQALQVLIRYVDFHLEHSRGRLFQYVDAHLNDYSQVDCDTRFSSKLKRFH